MFWVLRVVLTRPWSALRRARQVVDELLDVAKFEGRPHYQMASEIPLVFWEAAYDEIEWTYDPGTLPPTAAPARVPCAVCRVPCAVCRVPCAVCRVPCAVCRVRPDCEVPTCFSSPRPQSR
jgi:hypothetical protein